jgi:hypothetical protein
MGWVEAGAASKQRQKPTTANSFISSLSFALKQRIRSLSLRRERSDTDYLDELESVDKPTSSLVNQQRKVRRHEQGDRYHLHGRPLSRKKADKQKENSPNPGQHVPMVPDLQHSYRERKTYQDAQHPGASFRV